MNFVHEVVEVFLKILNLPLDLSSSWVTAVCKLLSLTDEFVNNLLPFLKQQNTLYEKDSIKT